jgi:UDP-glucuronate 4-epimerase
MKIRVAGAAGFIGMHTAQRLLEQGGEVVEGEPERLLRGVPHAYPNFRFVRLDIADSRCV